VKPIRKSSPVSSSRLIGGKKSVYITEVDYSATFLLPEENMASKKPDLNEVLEWCEQLKKLTAAIFTKPEIRKGDRNRWRNKAKRLLRKIEASF
jgi:hypothetical protein